MDGRKLTSRMLTVTIVCLCLTGAWISGELVKAHADLWSTGGAGDGLFGRLCRVTDSLGWDCAAAHRSPWSEVAVPIPLPTRDFSLHVRRVVVPVAFVGLAYFVFLATWFVFAGRPYPGGGPWQRIPLLVAWLGATVSVLYIVLMFARYAPACVWCAVAHAVNLVILFSVRRLYRRGRRMPAGGEPAVASCGGSPAERGWVPAHRPALHAVAFALLFIAALWFHRHEVVAMGVRLQAMKPYQELVAGLRADPEFLVREHYAQPRRTILSRQGEATDGRPRLVVFTDFECSACYCEEHWLRDQALAAFDGQLAFSVRHFPLNGECNPAVTGAVHPQACEAAYAAEAARLQGGEAVFWHMHRLLFADRHRLNPALYAELAERIGLDVQRFRRDLAGETVRRIVRRDVSLGRELGVQGTPAVFLDGREVTVFGRDNPVFWRALAQDRHGVDDEEICASAAP